MSKPKLERNIAIFHEQIEARLKGLNSPREKQQYLEGLFHAFDAVNRFANLVDLTPIEQQRFIANTKSWAYSKTNHLGLNPHKYMEGLIESEGIHDAKASVVTKRLQEALGLELSKEDKIFVENVSMYYEI